VPPPAPSLMELFASSCAMIMGPRGVGSGGTCRPDTQESRQRSGYLGS
jgi:hypothetical protein